MHSSEKVYFEGCFLFFSFLLWDQPCGRTYVLVPATFSYPNITEHSSTGTSFDRMNLEIGAIL